MRRAASMKPAKIVSTLCRSSPTFIRSPSDGERCASASSVCTAISRNVSITPTPVVATASCVGRRRQFSSASSSAAGSASARSRLFHCSTIGSFCGSSPFPVKLRCRLRSITRLFSRWRGEESATKTTPSAPASTWRRVVSYWICPGTV